jgi:hypothetical protein
MKENFNSRRDFIKKSAGVSAAIMAGGILPGFSASSYQRIMGANDKLNVSVMGVNSRGNALAQNFAFQDNCEVTHVCDVDSRAVDKCVANVKKVQESTPTGLVDFRKSLEDSDVDYPVKVSSNGGRFRYDDDWETPDTQVMNLDFPEGITMTWEGRSCNGKPIEGSSVGVVFYGEEGSLFIPGGNEYIVYDLKNNVVKEVKDSKKVDPHDAANPSSHLDSLHINNLFNNIRNGENLVADIDSGHKSTVLVQLGNITQRVGHSLEINPENGHIEGDRKAQKLWSRDYEKGWEMKL